MRGKYRMNPIAEVVILLLWMTGCCNVLPDSINSTEIGSRSVSLSPDIVGRFNDVADLVMTGEAGGRQQFGNRIFQGDVNSDGCEDLLVTASNYDSRKGRAYLYYGGPDMDANADKTFTGENAGDLFGEFAFLGELNNDNYDDVIVGSLGYNSRQGRVYIFYGGPDMDENADLILEGEMTDINFGQRITVGDVNNDGYKDLFVSAPRYQSYTGRAYLYYGGKIFDTTVDKTFVGEDTDDTFGLNCSVRGDIDGDGCNDLLVGTPCWPNNIGHGRAYLFYGAAGREMDVIPDIVFDAESGRDNFAVGLDLFDIDNDGYADVLISAREWGEGANASQGRAYIYWGSSRDTMDNVADLTFTGEAFANASFGGNTIYVGHVNNDPYGDIIIGAYNWYQRSRIGRAYLFYGGTKTSIDTKCDYIFHENKEPETNYGKEAKLCDLNNDGLDDVVLGGCTYNNGQGRVWIYLNKPLSSK